tara:strand:- start:4 stop:201 length:198 start_codon:yes stop_codon:yes gene_type:complete
MEHKNLKKDIEYLIEGIVDGDTQSYLSVMKRVDGVTELGNLPHKLNHYLSRRSYVKALEFLNSTD